MVPKVIYSIFISSIMVGNGIYIGPATLRQYCSILLFLYLCSNLWIVKRNSKLMVVYVVYILLYGISSLLNDGLTLFVKQFIAQYLVSIVAYYTSLIIFNKCKNFNYIIWPIIIIGIINSIVNLMQYYGNSMAIALGAIFVDMDNESQVAKFTHLLNGTSGNTFGIMGDIVYNSYYSMIVPFFILMKFKNKIILSGLLALTIFSLFTIGERSPFGITVLLLVGYLYIQKRNSPVFWIIAVVGLIVASISVVDLLSSDIIQNSRFVTAEDGMRKEINSSIISFILSNFIIGGFVKFVATVGMPPHNVIASGFIYAGFLGGFIILYILIKQASICLAIYKYKNGILYSLPFIAYTLNGFFHNPAIVTGDAMVWILWAMTYHSYKHAVTYNKFKYVRNKVSFNFSNCSDI